MIELRHLDVRHFVIEECRHLANGCTAKCDCIGLMLFCYVSYVWDSGPNNMRVIPHQINEFLAIFAMTSSDLF